LGLSNQKPPIAAVAPAIDSELFEYALKAGKFLLLLDGFDEIDSSMRDTLAKQIVELSYEFGENGIILTSRPDGPFGSWSEFHVAKMEAFNKKQVTSLVSKMDYVQQITTERPNDSVVDLLADINRDRFERKFLAPRIREFRNDLEAIDIAKNPVTAFKLFYITFSFHERVIASWTVGEGNFRPKWHYLLRFVERDSSFAGRHKMLNSFNWGDHFSKVHAEVTEDEVGHELAEVSDRSLSATPMVEYLQALKFAAIAMDSRLQATAANQQRLVSSALLKK
jgi:hypothetical protein